MAYCRECGVKLEIDGGFCNGCGVDLSEAIPETTFEKRSINFTTLDWSNFDWKPVISSGATILLMVAVLSFGSTLFQRDGIIDQPSDVSIANSDQAPDFSKYEDDFLSGIIELQVTSVANVRNYPTSRNTNILKKLSAGIIISGRWVRGFDPTTKWLKMEDGGYIWEGNLNSRAGQSNPANVEFPDKLRGDWSTRDKCRGGDFELIVVIASSELSIHEDAGQLERISKDKNGNPLYHVRLSVHGLGGSGAVDAVLKFTFNASGRMLTMTRVDDPNIGDLVLSDTYLNCDQIY